MCVEETRAPYVLWLNALCFTATVQIRSCAHTDVCNLCIAIPSYVLKYLLIRRRSNRDRRSKNFKICKTYYAPMYLFCIPTLSYTRVHYVPLIVHADSNIIITLVAVLSLFSKEGEGIAEPGCLFPFHDLIMQSQREIMCKTRSTRREDSSIRDVTNS